MRCLPNTAEIDYSSLPVYNVEPRAEGFANKTAIEWGERQNVIPCRDFSEYLELDANFPNFIVINAVEQFRHLCKSSKLTEHLGGMLYKTVFDVVLESMAMALDMIDNIYCQIEQAVDSYVSAAREDGNLDFEESDWEAENNLVSQLSEDLTNFALRVFSLILTSPIPKVALVGCPYEMWGLTPNGNVLLTKIEASRLKDTYDL